MISNPNFDQILYMSEVNKLALIILDGWGIGPDYNADAIASAATPFFDLAWQSNPHSTLITFGEEVGLPDGQMGNSEVGHLNLGAGRVVYQELARINRAIRTKELDSNPELVALLQRCKQNGKRLHLLGLLSDGGVHSHIDHLLALCDIIEAHQVPEVYIHAFTDGRDTDPKMGSSYVSKLLKHIKNQHIVLASIIGRYYAMDRDKRWERVKKAYDLLVHGAGEFTTDPIGTMEKDYQKGITDEFINPIVVSDSKSNRIQNGDAVLFFNFRTDRPRQLTEVLFQKDLEEYQMKKLDLDFVTMTEYDASFNRVRSLFKTDNLNNTLGEIIAKEGLSQLRIAETEKYPHVTFFFSGGRETTFEREQRILIPSAKVATYDLQPEMSAPGITEALLNHWKTKTPDFICLNFANTDMVGHTGVFKAGVVAAQTVDHCLQQLVEAGLPLGYQFIVLADHGNADCMINPDGSPNTAHSKNPVPLIYIGPAEIVLKPGKLGDIAPTILKLMGIEPPIEMTGEVLILPKI